MWYSDANGEHGFWQPDYECHSHNLHHAPPGFRPNWPYGKKEKVQEVGLLVLLLKSFILRYFRLISGGLKNPRTRTIHAEIGLNSRVSELSLIHLHQLRPVIQL